MGESELLLSFLIGLMVVAAGSVALSVRQVGHVQNEIMVKRMMRRLRGGVQPRVTVLVYASNQAACIERTLRTLKNNAYHAYDVVVVNDASTDQTALLVQRFCEKNPKAPIQLLSRRVRTSSAAALQAGYRKSNHGSIVIICTPDLPLNTSFIKRAVASKANRSAWRNTVRESLAPHLSLFDIGMLLERYYWQAAPYAQVFEARHFRKIKPTIALQKYTTLVRSGVAFLLLIALLVTAFSIAGVVAIWYAWLLVTAYGLVAVWLRYGEPLRDRTILTMSVPLAVFLIPVTSVVREFSRFTLGK